MIMHMCYDGYVYLLRDLRQASVPNNCQLKLDKVHRVNGISVISGVKSFIKMSPGNLEICLVGFVVTLLCQLCPKVLLEEVEEENQG